MKKIIGGFMVLSACLTGCNDGTINADFRLRAVDHPIADAVIEQKVNELYDKMNPQERLRSCIACILPICLARMANSTR